MIVKWEGGEAPVDKETKVRVRLRCGLDFLGADWNWDVRGSADDIVEYELVTTGDRPELRAAGKVKNAEGRAMLDTIESPAHALTFGPLAKAEANNTAGGAGKQTNPKDLVGSRKVPLSTLPFRVLWRVGLAMLEGMSKYGRHNYRIAGVRSSVYFDGAMRHLGAWWEGEDIDPDSGFSHIDKALATLMVLRDSMLAGNWVDDRPPRAREDFDVLNTEAARIVEQHADKKPRHWTIVDTPEAA